jgi:NAD(P)-dependent dehydrogenase (short-subunit alcohol dehydrogenase family)
MEINGRAALVTGGASGMGRATVLALAARGASVLAVDLDQAGAAETVARADAPERVASRSCDVTDSEQLAAAFEGAIKTFGRLDIVVNAAGIGDGDLFTDESAAWQRVIAIDLTALIDSTRLAVRSMRAAGHGGVVVNFASLIGLHPMAEAPVYSAAKAGVVGFTRALGDLAADSGIRVNAVCPELVDTPMALGMGEDVLTDLREAGTILAPEDVAASVIQLVEDDTRAGAIVRITCADGATYVD